MSRYKFLLCKRSRRYTQPLFVFGAVIALVVYLGIAWFAFPPDTFWSTDTGAKFLQLRNLRWEDGRPAYDIRYPGQVIDPTLRFATNDPVNGLLVIRGGKLHFQRLPIFPLLAWPWFHWFGFYGLYMLPALGGAASGVFALHLLKKRDRRFAMWLLIAFGSPIYIYSTIFWEHTVATGLVLFGAWLALQNRLVITKWYRALIWVIVGIILSFGAYLRLETLIFALAFLLALWLVVRETRWGTLCAGVTLGLSMLPYSPLHGILFAGQKIPGHAEYLFRPFRYLLSAKWNAIPDLLIGPFTGISLNTDWLGVLWAIAAVVVVAHSFGVDTPQKRVLRLVSLTITVVVGGIFLFTDVIYHSAHGLLFTTPWAILGMSRAYEVWQSGDQRARVVVLTSVFGLIGYTIGIVVFRGSSPHGGLEWGARFAMSLYPLLALIAAWDLGAKKKDVLTLAVVGALLFLGFGFQIRGLWIIRHDRRIHADLNHRLLELPEPHVVSDLGWFHLNAAPIYEQKQVFVVNTLEDLKVWVEQAVDQRIHRFVFVTLNHTVAHYTDRMPIGYRLEVINRYRVENLWLFQMHMYIE